MLVRRLQEMLVRRLQGRAAAAAVWLAAQCSAGFWLAVRGCWVLVGSAFKVSDCV